LAGFDDFLLVLVGRSGVFFREEIEIRLAYRLSGIVQAKLLGYRLAGPTRCASPRATPATT
jgi:hypothetical protein